MKHTNLLIKVMLVALTFSVVACGSQTPSQSVIAPTEILTSVPTETLTPIPTSTSIPEPTSTPTTVPTPIGGKSGLLLSQNVCPQNGDCVQTIFLYNLVSHELVPFLDGYTPLDVSPDGKKVLLKKNPWEMGDLFIVDLAQPNQITLLQENISDAAWLGDSGWIGFISVSKVNAKRQVFLIHPDGSDLKQVTNSSVGAVTLEPVFNDGVFWGEGTVNSNGSRTIRKSKWTKMDGTETTYINYYRVFPSGKSIMAMSMSPSISCWGCKFDLIDVVTSSKKEIILLPPEKKGIDQVLPLTDDKWLAIKFTTSTSTSDEKFWIYSSDGNILAELPDGYRMVDDSDPPSPYDILSPDGNWILVAQSEKISDEQFKVTYRFFDITTSEVKDLPNLYYTGMKIVGNRRIDDDIVGCRINKYFWVEMP